MDEQIKKEAVYYLPSTRISIPIENKELVSERTINNRYEETMTSYSLLQKEQHLLLNIAKTFLKNEDLQPFLVDYIEKHATYMASLSDMYQQNAPITATMYTSHQPVIQIFMEHILLSYLPYETYLTLYERLIQTSELVSNHPIVIQETRTFPMLAMAIPIHKHLLINEAQFPITLNVSESFAQKFQLPSMTITLHDKWKTSGYLIPRKDLLNNFISFEDSQKQFASDFEWSYSKSIQLLEQLVALLTEDEKNNVYNQLYSVQLYTHGIPTGQPFISFTSIIVQYM